MITFKRSLLFFFIFCIPVYLGEQIESDKNISEDVNDKYEIELGKEIFRNEHTTIEETVKHFDNNQDIIKYGNEKGVQIIELIPDEDAVNEEKSSKVEGYTTNLKDNTETRLEGYIVGGAYAKIADYPHAVFLMVCSKDEKCWACGSSVINQRILLTAAHCLEHEEETETIFCYAGSDDLKNRLVIRKVKSYACKLEFTVNKTGDIALMYIKDNLPLGPTIQRVVISSSFPKNAAELDGYTAGWGITDPNEKTHSKRLKVVQQKVWPSSNCPTDEVGILCASSGSKTDYAAYGDSGSALINDNKQQLGVLSYMHKSHPEILYYTNVSYYYSWIVRKSEELYCFLQDTANI